MGRSYTFPRVLRGELTGPSGWEQLTGCNCPSCGMLLGCAFSISFRRREGTAQAPSEIALLWPDLHSGANLHQFCVCQTSGPEERLLASVSGNQYLCGKETRPRQCRSQEQSESTCRQLSLPPLPRLCRPAPGAPWPSGACPFSSLPFFLGSSVSWRGQQLSSTALAMPALAVIPTPQCPFSAIDLPSPCDSVGIDCFP